MEVPKKSKMIYNLERREYNICEVSTNKGTLQIYLVSRLLESRDDVVISNTQKKILSNTQKICVSLH